MPPEPLTFHRVRLRRAVQQEGRRLACAFDKEVVWWAKLKAVGVSIDEPRLKKAVASGRLLRRKCDAA